MSEVSEISYRASSAVPHHAVRRLRSSGCTRSDRELLRPRILDSERNGEWQHRFVPDRVERRLIGALHALELVALRHTHIKLEPFDLVEKLSPFCCRCLDQPDEDDEQ